MPSDIISEFLLPTLEKFHPSTEMRISIEQCCNAIFFEAYSIALGFNVVLLIFRVQRTVLLLMDAAKMKKFVGNRELRLMKLPRQFYIVNHHLNYSCRR